MCNRNLDLGGAAHYMGAVMANGGQKSEKAERLAEALRANLRKRKAQSRARRGGSGIADGSSADVCTKSADNRPKETTTGSDSRTKE